MRLTRAPSGASGPDDPRLIAALEECLSGIESGLPPDRAALRTRYPDFAEDLFDCLDALEFVHRAAPEPSAASDGGPAIPGCSGRIGDYRLIRQVGRGGMGIVYEAVQVSLDRRVALKVLPFASALEDSQLQRFQNEARVAALLHHPHIVPVFATGCERRGIYYYAMQYIDGPSLAGLIESGRSADGVHHHGAECADRTPGITVLSTQGSRHPPADSSDRVLADRSFREVARLGAEAAEALEAAHQAGVIHRDIKPSNLLLDVANRLWVADFGLARFSGDGCLTRTGNLLGTLRYMSPEQALARPGLVDHRTDVYSLGATLYELITLRPAFCGSDRERLLRAIDRDEPPRPRSIDPAVPTQLEAVVLKAMSGRGRSRRSQHRGHSLWGRPSSRWMRRSPSCCLRVDPLCRRCVSRRARNKPPPFPSNPQGHWPYPPRPRSPLIHSPVDTVLCWLVLCERRPRRADSINRTVYEAGIATLFAQLDAANGMQVALPVAFSTEDPVLVSVTRSAVPAIWTAESRDRYFRLETLQPDLDPEWLPGSARLQQLPAEVLTVGTVPGESIDSRSDRLARTRDLSLIALPGEGTNEFAPNGSPERKLGVRRPARARG